MGVAKTLRSIDFVSALRGCAAARQEYESRGLEIGKWVERSNSNGLLESRLTNAGAIPEAIQDFIRSENDGEAIKRLTALCAQGRELGSKAALADLAARRRGFRTLEASLPLFIENRPRIREYHRWLDALPAFDLRPLMAGLAKEFTAFPKSLNPLSKIPECRAFEAWVAIYDVTNGFTRPAHAISEAITSAANAPGLSHSLVSHHMPALSEMVGRFQSAEDHRDALSTLLDIMDLHAGTGSWPAVREGKVTVVKGEVEVSLTVR